MKIIYENGENAPPAIMVVGERHAANLNDVATKMVPLNKRYLIINDSDLPDPDFADAWRVDFTAATARGTRQ